MYLSLRRYTHYYTKLSTKRGFEDRYEIAFVVDDESALIGDN